MGTLDEIVALLKEHQQRATYGAVAGCVKKPAIGLMKGRDHCHRDSWVVAQETNRERGSRRGWPTRYADEEIDPACLLQARSNPSGFIRDSLQLKKWLKAQQ
jgi:hypothetical protein